MAGRFSRFADISVDLLTTPSSINFDDKVKQELANFTSLFDSERAGSGSFDEAWTNASDRYSEHFKDELPVNFRKKIDEILPKKLQDPLKDNPTYVPIAVIVCTDDGSSDFFGEFNEATRSMLVTNDWESFPYKSLFILLKLASVHLPSRPEPKGNLNIFRGLDTDAAFTVGQTFSLGYFAPFTAARKLALRKKAAAAVVEDEEEDEEEETQPPVGGVNKVILKLSYVPKVQGLGVRLLSPHPVDEREVLVFPSQVFKVVEVKKRPKKGFSAVIVQPVVQ